MWVVMKEHWVHCQKKKCSINSLGRNIITKFYTEAYILHILVMKFVLVNLDLLWYLTTLTDCSLNICILSQWVLYLPGQNIKRAV